MMIHLTWDDSTHGPVPLCGRANWDGLTEQPAVNECWECASIAGVPHRFEE